MEEEENHNEHTGKYKKPEIEVNKVITGRQRYHTQREVRIIENINKHIVPATTVDKQPYQYVKKEV